MESLREFKMKRRNFIKVGAVGALGITSQAMGHGESLKINRPTPTEGEGPFYPVVARKDKDFDLTKVNGHDAESLGKHIFIHGSVFDTVGNPVEGATVDLWQANAVGRYSHPHDPNPAPIDDNFQGWAIVPSGEDGGFRFKTVLPGPYPVGGGWSRPPHIHFKVTKRGYVELVTQMYFPEQTLNQVDRLLQRKSEEEQKLMTAKRSADRPDTFNFRIVIEKV
jgi:protocatechuate 3,4-dioxygenase beta subunit